MNEIRVELKDHEEITIKFNYDPALLKLVKETLSPVSVYREIKTSAGNYKKFSHWKVIPDSDSLARLKMVKGDARFMISPKVWAFFETIQEWKESNYVLSMAPDSPFTIKGIKGDLRPFQRATVEYIIRNMRGVLVGEEMGLGKTVEAIAAIIRTNRVPALVICPSVVKYNWLKEFNNWSDFECFVINGQKEINNYAHEVLIINYDILESHIEKIKELEWACLILDESHFLKNYKSKRTQIVQSLAQQIPARILLSGTPILNRPQELIPQLQIMDRLNDLGGFWPFANRYCAARQVTIKGQKIWDMSGATNQDELNRRLRETCYVRHEKKEVLPDLPEKTRVDLFATLSNWPEYKQAQDDLIGWLKVNAVIPEKIIEKADEESAYLYEDLKSKFPDYSDAKRIEQADELRESIFQDYRDSAAYKAQRAEAIVKLNVLRQLAARGKISAAVSWIKNFFEQKNKLVVFAWHKFIIEELLKEFPQAETITGETTAEDRQEIVNRFQDDSLKLLICNIQAGGVGITLTAADTSLFIESAWNPGTLDQAEDRIYRMGQKNATTIYYLIGLESVDQGIAQMIKAKRENIESALDGFEYVREYLLRKG